MLQHLHYNFELEANVVACSISVDVYVLIDVYVLMDVFISLICIKII